MRLMFDNEKLQGIRGGQTQNGTTPKMSTARYFGQVIHYCHPMEVQSDHHLNSASQKINNCVMNRHSMHNWQPAYDFSIMAKKCRAKVLRQQGISRDNDPLIPKQ